MHRWFIWAVLCMGVSVGFSSGREEGASGGQQEKETAPNGRGIGTLDHPVHGPGKASNGGGTSSISYHGGPIMHGQIVIYYIWYGNWSGNSATTILSDLATMVGGSPYFKINTTYYDASNAWITTNVRFGGSYTVLGYPRGTALSDSDIQGIVTDAINGGKLPGDPGGVYFVLTSADVTAKSGFCNQYCGWHTHATINAQDIKYAFVGNPDRCPSSCEEQTKGPNGNAGADGMASIIAHELEESATDPDLNAWYDRHGAENADKCAWTFGSTYTTSNGAKANMTIGSRNYLIQQNWVNASGGYCAKSLP
jgi:hypothetical protein